MNILKTILILFVVFISLNIKADNGKIEADSLSVAKKNYADINSLSITNSRAKFKFNKKTKGGPNIFLGGTFLTLNMGQYQGFFSYSIDGIYQHKLFEARFKTVLSYTDKTGVDEIERNALPDAYRNYNITELHGTFFLFSYESKAKYRAFTGKTKYIGGGSYLVFYRNKETKKINKLGVRLGLHHHQEDVVATMYQNMERPDDYLITSYSVNSLFVGISKTSMASVYYGRYHFFKNTSIYFDMLFKLAYKDSYKKRIGEDNYQVSQNLNLFDIKPGWRIGIESKRKNGGNKFLGYFIGYEVGMLPVPKYIASAGLYFTGKLGIMIYGAVE